MFQRVSSLCFIKFLNVSIADFLFHLDVSLNGQLGTFDQPFFLGHETSDGKIPHGVKNEVQQHAHAHTLRVWLGVRYLVGYRTSEP
jgi:hypothetical protein